MLNAHMSYKGKSLLAYSFNIALFSKMNPTDAATTGSVSAFSNGKDQALSNTAVLNAGGNINYFEWNPRLFAESSASVPSQASVGAISDSSISWENVYASMLQKLLSLPHHHEPHLQPSPRTSAPLMSPISPNIQQPSVTSRSLETTTSTSRLGDNLRADGHRDEIHVNIAPGLTPGFHSSEASESLKSSTDAHAIMSQMPSSLPHRHGHDLLTSSLDIQAVAPASENLIVSLGSQQLGVISRSESIPSSDIQHVSNSGVDAECADEMRISMIPSSHIPGFRPSEALLKAPNDCEIYVKKMFPLRHGYPIWLPQPDLNLPIEYRRKGVSIGDVGYITPSGAFEFLFNIWTLPRNAADGVMDGFHSDSPPELETSLRASHAPRDMISSISDIEWEVDGCTTDISYSFENEDSGAILFMPYGASEEDYKYERNLKDFIAKNAETWYRATLQSGRDIDRHSLYLVTGCIKANSWGIATFRGTTSKRQSVLVIGESADPKDPAYIWKKSVKISSARTGPRPDSAIDIESKLPDTENQCLFLRGFKISLSEEAWQDINVLDVTLNERAEPPMDLDKTYGSTGGFKQRCNDGMAHELSLNLAQKSLTVSTSNFPPQQNLFHPLNLLNEMTLLQVSGARIAISHDNQWWAISGHNEGKGQNSNGIETIENRIQSQFATTKHAR
ncbi:hypothetical protein BDQ17DRAFT_871896 [Cyathus striatus]|nr:hypothetical protein BDQ17DRAFT_871896 [Cyathus striatus]